MVTHTYRCAHTKRRQHAHTQTHNTEHMTHETRHTLHTTQHKTQSTHNTHSLYLSHMPFHLFYSLYSQLPGWQNVSFWFRTDALCEGGFWTQIQVKGCRGDLEVTLEGQSTSDLKVAHQWCQGSNITILGLRFGSLLSHFRSHVRVVNTPV